MSRALDAGRFPLVPTGEPTVTPGAWFGVAAIAPCWHFDFESREIHWTPNGVKYILHEIGTILGSLSRGG